MSLYAETFRKRFLSWADEDVHSAGWSESVLLVEAGRVTVACGHQIPVGHLGKKFAEALEEFGAVALMLDVRSDAHLLEEEVVAVAAPLAMADSKGDDPSFGMNIANSCGSWSG